MPSAGRCAVSRPIRIGTRGSRLALAQAEIVRAVLANNAIAADMVVIRTSGDAGHREHVGAFVREIQSALLGGEVDLAVHSLKDLPTEPVAGLAIAAYLERDDPRDAIITRGLSWEELESGAVVGTGSLRRRAQLLAEHPGLSFQPLVGNVDTRLDRISSGEFDAVVLAVAGLRRLGLLPGWEDSAYANLRIDVLEPAVMLPAPGQGILVLESRVDDEGRYAAVNHAPSAQAAIAERAFLARFGGGCSLPVAALATPGPPFRLEGLVAAPDGSDCVRAVAIGAGEHAESIGIRLAEQLEEEGARRLLARMA